MWIYIFTPIRPQGVVLNYLSTGTTLHLRCSKIGTNILDKLVASIFRVETFLYHNKYSIYSIFNRCRRQFLSPRICPLYSALCSGT
jgi:hypothetical protein